MRNLKSVVFISILAWQLIGVPRFSTHIPTFAYSFFGIHTYNDSWIKNSIFKLIFNVRMNASPLPTSRYHSVFDPRKIFIGAIHLHRTLMSYFRRHVKLCVIQGNQNLYESPGFFPDLSILMSGINIEMHYWYIICLSSYRDYSYFQIEIHGKNGR